MTRPAVARHAALAGALGTLALGTAVFTTLGIGVTRLISNAEVAPVVVNLLVLPLTFISSVWFPPTGMPAGLVHIAKLFPVRAPAGTQVQQVVVGGLQRQQSRAVRIDEADPEGRIGVRGSGLLP